jgi:hypothetical protein
VLVAVLHAAAGQFRAATTEAPLAADAGHAPEARGGAEDAAAARGPEEDDRGPVRELPGVSRAGDGSAASSNGGGGGSTRSTTAADEALTLLTSVLQGLGLRHGSPDRDPDGHGKGGGGADAAVRQDGTNGGTNGGAEALREVGGLELAVAVMAAAAALPAALVRSCKCFDGSAQAQLPCARPLELAAQLSLRARVCGRTRMMRATRTAVSKRAGPAAAATVTTLHPQRRRMPSWWRAVGPRCLACCSRCVAAQFLCTRRRWLGQKAGPYKGPRCPGCGSM